MILDKLYELVQPITDDLNYILWGIEIIGDGKQTICVYIDHENGVSVDDCQKVSRQVSTIFDVEDPISGKYTLEVSSPGMNRRVFNIIQAEALIGFNVKAVLNEPINSQLKFKGKLVKVDNNDVYLLLEDGKEINFDFETLKKMRVSPVF